MKPIEFAFNDTVKEEIKEFNQQIDDFQTRKISADDFKHRRLLQGVYGQRQPALFMVRIKVPGGGLSEKMVDGVVKAVQEFARDQVHITTRQDIQLYNVKLKNIIPMLTTLAEYGLTTREASGATIRNIVISPFSGSSPEQAFDISDIVEKSVHFFLRNPETQHMPRKFKIAFSENDKDLASAGINDLGFVARIENNQPGFKVLLGGSLGSTPMMPHIYKEFIPAEDALLHTLSIIRAFNKYGDRSKRSEARIKFQLQKIGFDTFLSYVDTELEALKSEKNELPELTIPQHPPVEYDQSNPFSKEKEEEQYLWYEQNVRPTNKANTYTILARVASGDIKTQDLLTVKELIRSVQKSGATEFITLIDSQNLALKEIYVETDRHLNFSKIYDSLKSISLHQPGTEHISDVIACLGSATCASGITRSPALGLELSKHLEPYAGNSRFTTANIRVSGCANSCARHQVATLGFSGRADTQFKGDEHAPFYNIYYGGRILSDGNIKLGEKTKNTILAKRIPAFIDQLISNYKATNDERSFDEYVASIPKEELEQIIQTFSIENMKETPEEELTFDWGEDEPYVMEYGEGECS